MDASKTLLQRILKDISDPDYWKYLSKQNCQKHLLIQINRLDYLCQIYVPKYVPVLGSIYLPYCLLQPALSNQIKSRSS